MKTEKLIIYTDGGCEPNPGRGAWAYMAINEWGHKETEEVGYEEFTTNNKMELEAISRSLSYAKDMGIKNVKIKSDSQYAINSLTIWGDKWEKNDYKGKKNVDIIKDIRRMLKSLNAEFEWVRGHDGDIFNEYVDGLCSYEIRKNA
jgi:ribonuclease HI